MYICIYKIYIIIYIYIYITSQTFGMQLKHQTTQQEKVIP